MNPLRVAIAGLGNRGRETYAECQNLYPELMKVTAVADTSQERLSEAAEAFGLPASACFKDAEAMAGTPGLADVMFICTPDRFHTKPAILALKNGYHLLLEKPIAPTVSECDEILAAARETGRKTAVCHVLRYTPFYNFIRDIIERGDIGDVVTIQAIENVGYYHQAHSFVRGNWSNSELSSPMILQKCCHDIDIILWLAGRKPVSVSSFGGLYLFKPEMAPEGAAARCLDGCAVKEDCPFDAERIYIHDKRTGVAHGRVHWPNSVLTPNPTPETVMEAIKTGPYGRCVYHCDNDVTDHMIVNLLMEGGVTASLTMTAFTDKISRHIKVMGTKGEIEGSMGTNTVTTYVFGKEPQTTDITAIAENLAGHGGGDQRLVKDFLTLVQSGGQAKALTDVEASVVSHYICLAAEESRLDGGRLRVIGGK